MTAAPLDDATITGGVAISAPALDLPLHAIYLLADDNAPNHDLTCVPLDAASYLTLSGPSRQWDSTPGAAEYPVIEVVGLAGSPEAEGLWPSLLLLG